MSAPKVDVLAVIRKHAEAHRALAGSDAYSAQEAPKLEATLAAVAELIEAARNASAVLGHAYHTQINGELADDAHDAYQRLDAALAATTFSAVMRMRRRA